MTMMAMVVMVTLTSTLVVVKGQTTPTIPQCMPELQVVRNALTVSAFAARDVAVGDVSGNGLPDVVAAAENANAIFLFPMTSPGVFSLPPVTIQSSVSEARSATLYDLNSDGNMDVVYTAPGSNSAAYKLSTGGTSFGGQVSFPTPALTGACAAAVAQLDGSLGADVVVSAPGASALVWFANSAGPVATPSFVTPGSSVDASAMGSGACALDSGDFDGDGDVDLLLGGSVGGGWFANDGAGTFAPATMLYTGSVGAVVAGDVDADADIDVAIGSVGAVRVYVNPGDGSFTVVTLSVPFSAVITSLDMADYSGDAAVDIIVGSLTPSRIGFLATVVPGVSFASYLDISTQADGVTAVAAIDLLNDGGAVDLVSASVNDDAIATYTNAPLVPKYGTARVVSTAVNGVYSVAAADIDGDGDVDIVSAGEFSSRIEWYPNVDGSGLFGLANVVTQSASAARFVVCADLDADGDVDIASASSGDNTVAWYPNSDGRGTFTSRLIISAAASSVRSLGLVDLNGDGALDILAAERGASRVAAYYYLGFGASSSAFSAATVVATGVGDAIDVAGGDIDNDGLPDVVAVAEADNNIEWFKTLPGGMSWGAPVAVGTAIGPRAVAVGDLDADNDLDVAVAATSGNELLWFRNDALGATWTTTVLDSALDGARDVLIADLDSDGDLDVAAVSLFNDIVGVVFNNGGGSFAPLVTVDSAFDGAITLAAGDVDGDGDLDLVSGAISVDTVAWFSFLRRTSSFVYAPASRAVAIGSTPTTPAWWDCQRSSVRCLLAHASSASRCVTDTLVVPPDTTFTTCLADGHARITYPLVVSSASGATINCSATGGGVLFDVGPHPLPTVPLAGALTLDNIDVIGMTTAAAALDGAPGLRVVGSGASLTLRNATVSDASSSSGSGLASVRATDIGRGGALLVASGGVVDATHCVFRSSSASEHGGAIAIRDPGSKLMLNESRVEGCSAPRGGGVYASSGAAVSSASSLFAANSASLSFGGGIALENGAHGLLSDASFARNSAALCGGAMYVTDTSELAVSESSVTGNTARYGGGLATVAADSVLSLESATSSATAAPAGLGPTTPPSTRCGRCRRTSLSAPPPTQLAR